MNSAKQIIEPWFDRAGLPSRIQTLKPSPYCPMGTVLEWSTADRAYRGPGGAFFVWADTVKNGWGLFFCVAPALQLELIHA